MTETPSISQLVEAKSVVSMECTIPADMTIDEWRRQRPARPRRARAFARAIGGRRVVPLRPVPCDHVHDTTTRYDHEKKQLSFLLVCPTCGTEKLIDSLEYEPRFRPHPADERSGANVYELTPRRQRQPTRRAA